MVLSQSWLIRVGLVLSFVLIRSSELVLSDLMTRSLSMVLSWNGTRSDRLGSLILFDLKWFMYHNFHFPIFQTFMAYHVSS